MKQSILFTIAFFTLLPSLFAQDGIRSTQSIGMGEITVMELAGNGDIWVGSKGNGIGFYNAVSQQWTYYNTGNTPQITSDTIYDLELSVIGGVQHSFAGTADGLSYSQASVWNSSSPMLGAKVWGIHYRPDSLWVMSNQGISNFDSLNTLRSANPSPFSPITCVQSTISCSGVWTGTGNNGIYYTENGTAFSYIDTSILNKKLVDNRVNTIATENNCARVIVGTKGGLSICPTPGPPCLNFTTANGLPQNDITAIASDCAGRIWLGTRDSGIVIYSDPLFFRLTTANGLPSNQITTMAFTPDCKLSIGMKDGNLAVADTAKTILQILSGVGQVKEVDYTMHIYPQPAATEINFISEREMSNGEFLLSDLTGRTIQSFILGNTNRFRTDVSTLSQGIYLYQIISQNEVVKRGKLEVVK